MGIEYTEQEVVKLLEKQNRFFHSQATRTLKFRIQQLRRLKGAIKKYEEDITQALFLDLGKPRNESYMTEIGFEYYNIEDTIRNLKKWMRPEPKRTPLASQPAKSWIISEPYGTVLIIGPYNYPFHLVIEPLIGAIAAGNTAVVKPSNMTPYTEKVIWRMLKETFPPCYIQCVTGTRTTTTALLHADFDYIFFTGSPNVGKVVMSAAAEHLIPVTLELGGKSPVLVDETANIREAARRIIWGKTINAGQTCIAPDFVLVEASVKKKLLEEMKLAIQKFFGEDPQNSQSFGRIVNERHFERISAILDKDKKYICFGGKRNRQERFIEPTLLDLDSWNGASMEEEIFGPVLPVITYEDREKVLRKLQKQPKPLALYIFSKNKKWIRKVTNRISSGNVCINDTISHITNSHIPFGGVGNSGMGSYHGVESFRTFSHRKGILQKPSGLTNFLIYPPFSKGQLKFVKTIFK